MREIDNDMPPSFKEALDDNYLGSPKVVEGILKEFVSEIYDWVHARGLGVMTSKQMTEKVYAKSYDFAEIFSVQNDKYKPVVGWNSNVAGLCAYLKVDLGHYWREQKEAFNGDPYRVFYGWLVWAVVDGMVKNNDDEIMTAFVIGDRIEQAVRLLAGTAARR